MKKGMEMKDSMGQKRESQIIQYAWSIVDEAQGSEWEGWRGNGEPDDREHFTMIIHLDFIL